MVCVLRKLPKNSKPLEEENLVSMGARTVGVRAFSTPGGKVVLEMPNKQFVSYDSLIDADRAIRNLQVAFKKETTILRAISKDATVDAGAPVTADIPIEEVLPEVQADRAIYDGTTKSISDPRSFPLPNETIALGGSSLNPFSVRVRLRRMGKPGIEMAEGWARVNTLEDLIKAKFYSIIERAHKDATRIGIDTSKWGLLAEERSGAQTLTPEQAAAFKEINNRVTSETKKMLTTGKFLGLDVKKELENFFPHTLNFAQMTEGDKKALIDGMIESGLAASEAQALTVIEHISTSRDTVVGGMIEKVRRQTGLVMSTEQAEIILDRYNKGYKVLAGHLEKERYGIPGYTEDLRLAYLPMINSNAKRIATATVWGAKGDRLHSLINQLPSGRARKFAEQVKDLELGFGKDRLENFWRWIYDVQSGKLLFSALPNAGQWMNLFIPAGYRRTLTAFVKQLFNPIDGQRRAAITGAISESIYTDLRAEGAAGVLKIQPRNMAVRLLSAVDRATLAPLRKIVLMVFKTSEEYLNRSISVRLGDSWFDELDRVISNPKSTPKQLKKADQSFREFGLTSDAVLKSKNSLGENDPDLIEAMRSIFSQNISNMTQGKFGVQNVPLWAQSQAGQVFTHFKKFPFFQAKFMLDGLAGGPTKDWRVTLRTLTVFGAFIGVGFGLTELRSKLLQKPTKAKKLIDEFLEDETVQGHVAAAITALSQSGATGILADVAYTSLQGGNFNTSLMAMGLLLPPEASSAVNAFNVINGIGRGVVKGGDPEEFKAAARAVGAEFGIVGRGVTDVIARPRKKGRKPKRLRSLGELRGLGGLGGL